MITTERHNIKADKDKHENFKSLIEEIKRLQMIYGKSVKPTIDINRLTEVLEDFKLLKAKVYPTRLQETKDLIEHNMEMFKMTSFELMEHNFRENTHSNILEYIFDYDYTGFDGIEALFLFLCELENCKINDLKTKLYSKNYYLEREYNVKKGRIDLLIKDDVNKLVIIIENKVRAKIAEKDYDEETEIKTTQLDLYKSHFLKDVKYEKWDKVFVLLSYKNGVDFKDSHFEMINYETLYNVLKNINFKDPIANDYNTLLYGLTKNIHDKRWLIEQSRNILEKEENINLNTLETLNNFINEKG